MKKHFAKGCTSYRIPTGSWGRIGGLEDQYNIIIAYPDIVIAAFVAISSGPDTWCDQATDTELAAIVAVMRGVPQPRERLGKFRGLADYPRRWFSDVQQF